MVRFSGVIGCRAGVHELDRKRIIYFAALMSTESFLCSTFAGFHPFNATCPERFEVCPALCILVLAGVGRCFLIGDRGWTNKNGLRKAGHQSGTFHFSFVYKSRVFFFSWKDFKFS